MSDFDETCRKKQVERGIKRVERCVCVRHLERIIGTMFRRLKYI